MFSIPTKGPTRATRVMLLRAVVVCAILAVALAAPDIMEEDEDDEVDLSSLAS